MKNYTTEVIDICISLQMKCELTDYEALQIAVKIQLNTTIADVFLLGLTEPSALEAMVMALRDLNRRL